MPDTQANDKPVTVNTPPAASTPVKTSPVASAPAKPKASDFVKVEKVDSAMNGHNFRGFCTKCGWQTYQPLEQLAKDGVVQHVRGRHDVE